MTSIIAKKITKRVSLFSRTKKLLFWLVTDCLLFAENVLLNFLERTNRPLFSQQSRGVAEEAETPALSFSLW